MTQILKDIDKKSKIRSAFSGWPMVIGWIAMFIFAIHACTHMVGAGDTWVAMSCGRHFVHHGVDTNEPFSANSHRPGPTKQSMDKYAKLLRTELLEAERAGKKGVRYSLMGWWADKCADYENWPQWKKSFAKWIHPTGWINQNWLTHVIFYSLVPKSTYTPSDTYTSNALVYWKFAIYILTIICVYYTTRLLGVNPMLSAAFTCFAIFTGRSYFDVRPAGFSNLLVAVYLLVLVLTTYRNVLYIWLIIPITVFWCNAHGGYLYVFIMLVPFVFFHFVMSLFKNRFVSIGRRGLYHTIAAGIVAFVAMIIFNPFHLTNLTHTFVISVSKHAEMWRNVNEWHPGFEWMNPVGTAYPFLIVFVLGIAVPLFWLYGRFMKPKFLTAPKARLDAQQSVFSVQFKIFSIAAAIFICWCTLLSLSFINYDFYSFIICAIFVGIILHSVFYNVHSIYAFIPFIILILWSSMNIRGYAGRYIYPFILLPLYFIINTIASLTSKKIKLKPINLICVTATAAASLILMIFIFNPFKFQMPEWNFEDGAWLSSFFEGIRTRFVALKYLLDARVMWRPKFINNAEPSYGHLFMFLYVVNILAIIFWLIFPYLKRLFNQISEDTSESQDSITEDYQVPKVDLALIAIAALTVYMAVRMRRFIPIAAIAACPLLALFVEQLIRGLSASVNLYRNGRFVVPRMPGNLRNFIIIVAASLTAYLGTHWALKFKRIYLDAWPTDDKLTSVFMRMTASDAKPFYALKFIKDNKLEGKMFNYWTEGGFIAWGQQPDPKTGKTPLQLFMDGRAQAAYEPEVYKLWSYIMAGGPDIRSAIARRTAVDYRQVGIWLDNQLRKYDVWVVLMPAAQFGSHFVKGLDTNKDWFVIFFNNKQRLYINKRHPQAQKLIEGIETGKTIYPNQFSKDLVLSYYRLFSNEYERKKEGLELAIRACNAYPSRTPMEWITVAARFEGLKPRVTQFCTQYFDDFIQNMDEYKKQNAYHDRTVAAMLAGNYLKLVETELKNNEKALFYGNKVKELEKDVKAVIDSKRW